MNEKKDKEIKKEDKENTETIPKPFPNHTKKEDKENTEKNEKKNEEIREPIQQKTKSIWSKLIFFITSASIIIFLYYTNAITTPNNATLIIYLTLSFMLNAIIIIILFVTRIGDDVIQRFRKKIMYKTGNYVNTLFVTKTGLIMELFQKKDHETGTFKISHKSYITNPSLMFNFNGIPTYTHREGNPDPLNIWDNKIAGDLSTAEMDIAMNSKGVFDVKEWLEKNKQILILAAVLMVLSAAIAGYFGYQAYEMLRDGTYKQVTDVACNNLPNFNELIPKPLG